MDHKLKDRLEASFLHVINACRTGNIPLESRNKRIRAKRPYFSLLFSFRSFGLLLYCLSSIFKTYSIQIYKNGIIQDHSSGIIVKSLNRVLKTSIEKDVEEVYIKLSDRLISFFILYRTVATTFNALEINNVTEFFRVTMIAQHIVNAYAFFQNEPPKFIFIVDENNHKMLSLGVLSHYFKVPVYTFSVALFSAPTLRPFKVDVYFCWTQEQKEAIMKSGVLAVQLPVEKHEICLLPDNGNNTKLRVGLLLSSKYNVQMLRQLVGELKSKYNLLNVNIRPHPGRSVEELKNIENSVLCKREEHLIEYLKKMDCVFAPDTNAIVEAILFGVPVVYVREISDTNEDVHGFVKNGLVIKYSEELKFPEMINDFYKSKRFLKSLNSIGFTYSEAEARKVLIDIL